jgi:ATP-dependent protease HslVU (ClpYQ) ATPase subunit
LVNAPFIKVEATKYTEIGFHGAQPTIVFSSLCSMVLGFVSAMVAVILTKFVC